MALVSKWKPGKEEVVAENGVVTAMLPQSAEAGLHILKSGGNAVDAAVAMCFCNVVLEPEMATIAGMGYMLIHLAGEGKTVGVDFNGRAPAGAHPGMYHVLGPSTAGGFQIFAVEDDANNAGALSLTVPATCAGLCEAHRRYGRLPLEQVLEPAAHLATEGFEANWYITLWVANAHDRLNADPELARIWMPNGRPPTSQPKPGERIVQRDLGDLLARIGRSGPDAMYRGEVAAAIEEHVRKGGGVLTADDLARYAPVFGEPLSTTFKGSEVRVVATPSGGVTNLQTFAILDNFDLASLGHNTVPYLHTLVESARHAFADRFRYLGDWEHTPVPIAGMLSRGYAREIAGKVNRQRAEVGVGHGEEPWIHYLDRAVHDPWRFDPSPQRARVFEPAMDGNDEATTHVNVVDRDRNVVSVTHTGGFREKNNPPGTGVYLVGGMGWFIPLGGYANSVAGWKRPMNNMSPLIVFRDGKPVLSQGAPGARRIMNRNLQVVVNVTVFGMSPQEAINAPVVDASSMKTVADSRLPDDVIAGLRALGHDVAIGEEEPGPTWNFAHPTAIEIDHETGLLRAGVDPYRPSMALGY